MNVDSITRTREELRRKVPITNEDKSGVEPSLRRPAVSPSVQPERGEVSEGYVELPAVPLVDVEKLFKALKRVEVSELNSEVDDLELLQLTVIVPVIRPVNVLLKSLFSIGDLDDSVNFFFTMMLPDVRPLIPMFSSTKNLILQGLDDSVDLSITTLLADIKLVKPTFLDARSLALQDLEDSIELLPSLALPDIVVLKPHFTKPMNLDAHNVWEELDEEFLEKIMETSSKPSELSKPLIQVSPLMESSAATPPQDLIVLLEETARDLEEKRAFSEIKAVFRPIVLLVEDDIGCEALGFLERIARETYRIIVRGYPDARHVEYWWREPWDLLRFDMSHIGGNIVSINAEKIEVKNIEKIDSSNDQFLGGLADRMKEIYSQGLGFLILYGRSERIKALQEALSRIGIWGPTGSVWDPKKIVLSEELCEHLWSLTGFMFGSFSVEREKGRISLNPLVSKLEDKFYESLEKLWGNVEFTTKVKHSSRGDNESGESLIHYLLKVFIFKALSRRIAEELVRTRGLEMEEALEKAYKMIKTEESWRNVVVDVLVDYPGRGSIAIEVETLYGTGVPENKIAETIKTRLATDVKELWIVIPNPSLTAFLPNILKLYVMFKKKHKDRLKFFTLDIEKEDLIPLEEAVKILKSSQQLGEIEEENKV